MVVSKSYELEGFFGGLADLVRDVALFIGAAALLNPVVAGGARLVGLIMVGSELAELSGVHVIGPGGLVGLVVAGGASFLFGGGVFVPVFVGGAVASELLVKHRSLAEPEMAPARDFAKRVFGDTLPFDRVILTNLSGENGQEFVTPSVDGSILMNMGDGFDNPTTHVDPRRGFIVEGQIFIHELTHVWQIAHAGIIADYFWRAALDKVGGSASYNYGPPGPVFSSFGLEAQASLVEEWFSGTDFDATMSIPGRSKTNPIGMQDNDPYIGYINNNIRLAEA
jgi:hypothetical protein